MAVTQTVDRIHNHLILVKSEAYIYGVLSFEDEQKVSNDKTATKRVGRPCIQKSFYSVS